MCARQEALGIEVVQPSGGRGQPRLDLHGQVVGRGCDRNGVDSPDIHLAAFEQHGHIATSRTKRVEHGDNVLDF